MAKNLLASSEAILRAAQQSQRLAEQMAGNSALLAAERAAIHRLVMSEQIAGLARTPVRGLGLQGAALLASQRVSEALAAAQERRTRTLIELPERPRLAAEFLSPRLTGLAAAEAMLRDSNHAAFRRSAEMVSTLVQSAASLRDLSGFQGTLEAARLSQDRLSSIVERLATATIADLEPEEAQGVASAFGEAVASVTATPGADFEDFGEKMVEAVLARLPAQKAGGPSMDLLLNLIVILLALVGLHQDRQGGKADVKNTEEITSRQDEGNDLLRRSLEEWQKCSADSLLRVRLVDREAHIFTKPVKGAAVLAVVPEGVQVIVLDVWGRWAKVTYLDAVAEVRRTGWVLKKYLE